MVWVALLVGLFVGALAAWLWFAPRLQAEARSKREALEAAEKRFADLQAGEERLQLQLKALLPQVAEAVLGAKTDQLRETARGEFQLIEEKTAAEVGKSQTQLQAAMEGMNQHLEAYARRFNELEQIRAEAAQRVEQQLAQVAQAGASMATEARTLQQALRTNSAVRGRWGEEVLKNILNSCGLNEGTDYELQAALGGGDGRLRPDAIVHLPSGRNLVIDSKASLAGFLDGLDDGLSGAGAASDENRRREQLRGFALSLRRRADELGGKDYARNLENSVPCVVMFLPSEAAFRAALDADPELFRYGQDKRPSVLLASPTTLFPLIAIVAHGWRQHSMEQRAQELIQQVNAFAKSLGAFFSHVQKVGAGLDAAGKAFNEAEGSFQSRLAPKMEKLAALGAEFPEIKELKPVENRPLMRLAAAAGSEPGAGADTSAAASD